MESETVEAGRVLVEEVMQWLEIGDGLLSGMGESASLSYDYGEGTISIAVTNAAEYHQAIHCGVEGSIWTELGETLNSVQEASFILQSYGCDDFKDLTRECSDRIFAALRSHPRTKPLATKLRGRRPSGLPGYDPSDPYEDDPVDELVGVMAPDFSSILDARLASLSRRHAVTEAIFMAYRSGLVPFGWDVVDETLWCINPADLDSRSPIPVHDEEED